ncbi:MAG TPA: ABC transporter substrate-binding protein [Thermoanaerobaculia bacterium]|nr:ABC transporter substrate-binding protein [Thermoanaerobaculia bacterium]
MSRRLLLLALAWALVITGAHMALNVNWAVALNDLRPKAERKLNVAYVPVTCHLACPVTDYISKFTDAGELFVPRMFQGFPEIKEALIADKMQAGFVVAPMAIALRSQGVPLKIVYLGHRYGSSLVVRRDSPIRTVADLRGGTIAIPSRFSDERLLAIRALQSAGIGLDEVKMPEMAPPDMPAALSARAIDAFVVAEPFPAQAEISGIGRILFQARDYWPDYISCVLVVRQDVIDTRPQVVQALVDGIARSGLWLEGGRENRVHAADFVGRYYYHQRPKVLEWALTRPLDRVMYEPLSPYRRDFELVSSLMVQTGVLERDIPFEQYVDVRFAEGADDERAWDYRPGSQLAR